MSAWQGEIVDYIKTLKTVKFFFSYFFQNALLTYNL